jgi:hypothetical protein
MNNTKNHHHRCRSIGFNDCLPLTEKKGIDVLILEANTRIGGRIETVTGKSSNNGNGCL